MKEKVEVDGVITWFTSMFMTKRIHDTRKNMSYEDICPLCKKDIEGDTDIITVTNNYGLFPNTIIHRDCSRGVTYTDIVNRLKDDYIEAKKYRCWFK